MLHAKDWAGLQGLVFVAKRLVEGLYAGGHATPQSGPGIEFHDYRSYSPGDNPSSIDWKLYGRTDRLYLRRFKWFTDLHAMVMVDCSASMNFAALEAGGRTSPSSQTRTKLHYAQTLAAAIAFLTVRQADRVGVGLYSDKLIRHMPVGGTWSHLMNICQMIEQSGHVQGVGDAASGLLHAHALMRRSGRHRGVVVLISDLLGEPSALFDGLNRLRHDRFEAIVFQVLTPQELDLAGLGRSRLQLVDLETRKQVSTHIGQIQQRYTQLMTEHLATLRRGCLNRGVDYNLLTTDQPVIDALRRYVVRRASLRG